ncbi:MAG: TonB-dependent receptor [Vicinamibacterales bacterium]
MPRMLYAVRHEVRWVGVLLVVLSLAGPGAARAQDVTGTLYGTVSAEDGSRLPGATVSITSPQLIKAAEIRVTGGEGEYRVQALPPGVYAITVELQGFRTVNREGISLRAGMSLGVDFRLGIASVDETITVVGESPLVDVKNSEVTRTIGETLIENVPLDRRAGAIVATLPSVIEIEGGLFEAQSVQGGRQLDNLQSIDGAVANDPSGGSLMLEIPVDMLEQVQVTTGGISAEFGQASAAVFSYITKSGGNEFHGGASGFISGEDFQSSNLTEELSRSIAQGNTTPKDTEYGFNLGGPIKRDRLWFFGTLRWLSQETQRPEFTQRNQEKNQHQWFVKFTGQALQSTRAEFSMAHRTQSLFPHENDFRFNVHETTWFESVRDNRVYNSKLTHVFNSSTYIDGQFSRTRWQLDRIFPLGDTSGYQDVVTQVFSGGWHRDFGKYFKRDVQMAKGTVSHFRSSHQLKGGIEVDWAPYFREHLVPDDTFYLLRNGAPYRVRLYNTPREAKSAYRRVGGFVQDQWTVGDRLTLNLGVRFESAEAYLPEQSGGGGRWFPPESFPEVAKAVDWFYTSPRLGAVWALDADRKTALKASYGRYFDAITISTANPANRNRLGFREHDWADLNNDFLVQPNEIGTLRRDLRSSQNVIDPDLSQPYVDAIHVGVERQLSNDWGLTITGIYKNHTNFFEALDTLPFSAYNPVTVTNPLNNEPLTIYALKPEFQGVQRVEELTNVDGAFERYVGLELVTEKRMADNWQFLASMNLATTKGNTGDDFSNPNALLFQEGPLAIDLPLQLKLQGSYLAPYDIVLSAYYLGQEGFLSKIPSTTGSGVPGASRVRFSRSVSPLIVSESFIEVRGEERGSRRTEFRNLVALRAEKQFRVRQMKLGILADVFNLFNASTVIAVQSLLHDQPNYLLPAQIVQPRTVRLGVRLDF